MAETAELARARGVRLHTHMAETIEEDAYCLEKFGVRPVEFLDELGWLGDDVWLAHCVHLNEREVARFGETRTGVAHCPTSNARLGAGIAPVVPLLAAGAPVGLGVDGAASNEGGELGAELHQALLMARARGGPAALTAAQALELGTRHGARCLGREDELGSLEPGKLADLVLWRLDGVDRAGIADPVAALVLLRAAPRRPRDGRREDRRRGRRAADGGLRDPGARAGRGGALLSTITTVRNGVGQSVRRPDGIPKVKGEFAYSSDMWAEDMLWGATLRSPHPRARVRGIEIGAALAVPGVRAVLTHHDVPGRKTYGLEHHDQPVLAFGEVRYQGEPVAIVAADHPETARRAADRIEVDYEELEPLVDPERALDPETPPLHPVRERAPARLHRARAGAGRGRRGRHRRVRGRHAGPGVPRAGVGARGARRGRRRGPVHLHPVAARGPRPGGGGARPAAGQGALHAGRRRRRVRRARGRVDADPRLPARAAHEPAGEDGLRARGVVLRPRPPPPGADALRARRVRRRAAGVHPRPDPAGRRRLRLLLQRRRLQRGVVRARAVRRAVGPDRRHRRLHGQPAVRGDARVRRRADVLRPRGADGQARGGAGHGPRRAAAA